MTTSGTSHKGRGAIVTPRVAIFPAVHAPTPGGGLFSLFSNPLGVTMAPRPFIYYILWEVPLVVIVIFGCGN